MAGSRIATNINTVVSNDKLLAQCSARSTLYGLLSELFQYPDDELYQAVTEGEVRRNLHHLLSELYPELIQEIDWSGLENAGENEQALAVEFTRLFDAGMKSPESSLYGATYFGAQMKTMEEVIRFYQHFGVTRSESAKETPDHIVPQLEFLHYLAYGEWNLRKRCENPEAYILGHRDFIARHPGRWIPMMHDKLIRQKPAAFFATLVKLTDSLLQTDLSYYESLLGKASVLPKGTIPFVEL